MTRLGTSELAKQCGINLESIRFYEKEGLLPKPPRTAGGYRMFSPDDLDAMNMLRCGFDPDGRCNPGKVFPTPRLCGEVPGHHRQHPLEREGVAERW